MTTDLMMAWRNIWRNPRRTVLTLSAIAFACLILVFMLSFQLGSYDAMINASVRIHAGHVQVQAEGYHEEGKMRMVVPNPSDVGEALSAVPEIESYTFRANGFSLVSSESRTHGGMVIGIDSEREAAVSRLPELVREGEYLHDGAGNGALVGSVLARNLQVGVGEKLTLLGQGRDGSVAATVVTVQGLYRSGIDELDRSVVYIPLAHFQEVYSMRGAVHRAVALVDRLADVGPARRALAERLRTVQPADRRLVVLDWNDIMPGLLQGIKLDLISGFIFYVLLVVVVAFSILNTFLMAVLERTKEVGVLMAIGTRPLRLLRLILFESAFLTAVGIAGGIVLGAAVTLYFQQHGLDLGGSSEILEKFGISGRLYPRLTVVSAVAGPLLVLLITVFTALVPAVKVIRLDPVEAMTHV